MRELGFGKVVIFKGAVVEQIAEVLVADALAELFARGRTRGGGSWGAHLAGTGRACGAQRVCVE